MHSFDLLSSQVVMFLNGHLTYHKSAFEALTAFEGYQKELSLQVKLFNKVLN